MKTFNSLRGAAQTAERLDAKMRRAAKAAGIEAVTGLTGQAADSFVNFAQKMGVGADNPMSTASYGFNPVTRIRTVLEWCYRGSWLGGMAVDIPAEDMTRAGIEILGKMKPDEIKAIHTEAVKLGILTSITDNARWSRLYGGSLAVMILDGQDLATQLRPETVGKDQFKGIVVLDRWMVEADMSRIIAVPGPRMGEPMFYTVRSDSPGLRNERIHYSRCLRMVGIKMPHWQAVMEQMWGVSVLERMWDRMTAFDSATTGIAQLVYKAWIRTQKIKGLRQIVAQGGNMLRGLLAQMDLQRRTQSIEGLTLMDADDEFEGVSNTTFSGLSDALLSLGQQVSGALGIPLVRLFGQSPAGLNSTGESDLRMYYDTIAKDQAEIIDPVTTIYSMIALSKEIKVPDDFGIRFRPLWQLSETEKADIAETDGRTIVAAEAAGLISPKTALKELRQSSLVTGRFTNITEEEIDAANEEAAPSGAAVAEEELKAQKEMESHRADEGRRSAEHGAKLQEKAAVSAAKREAAVADAASTIAALFARHPGVSLAIENVKGSVRRSKDLANPWEAILAADYGYARRTTGSDEDEVDCFVGDRPDSDSVWVLLQVDPETRAPDEVKCLLAFASRRAAISAYLASYVDDASRRIGSIMEMSWAEFEEFLDANPYRAFGGIPSPKA